MIFGFPVSENFLNLIHQKIIKDYNDEVESQPKQIRGCEHSVESTKFCPECGKPKWIKNSAYSLVTEEEVADDLMGFYDYLNFSWVHDRRILEYGTKEKSADGSLFSAWSIGIAVEDLDRTRPLRDIQEDLAQRIKETFNYTVQEEALFEEDYD